MLSAKAMSEAIRLKRKKVQDDGVDNMVDTAALPQMNPQDIMNLKQQAQMHETMDIPKKSEAPSDPSDERIDGTSQDIAELKKQMSRIEKIFARLHMSDGNY